MTRKQCIHITLCYADIFAYPLTRAQLRRWLVFAGGLLPRDAAGVQRHDAGGETYYTLPHRGALVPLRQKRKAIADRKWRTVSRIAAVFRWIPTVYLVGVTGGLSMDNAKKGDDIDLFFITVPGALWVTRLLVTVTADVLGVRRHPGERRVTDKICLNMFMASDALALPARERDLFAAHEVLQMRLIWQRNGVYRQFLTANRWVQYFLPNAWEEVNAQWPMLNAKWNATNELFSILEPLARAVQLWYMRSRRTTEVIAPGVLRFHPRDARVRVKKELALRLKKQNIPLDKIFFHR